MIQCSCCKQMFDEVYAYTKDGVTSHVCGGCAKANGINTTGLQVLTGDAPAPASTSPEPPEEAVRAALEADKLEAEEAKAAAEDRTKAAEEAKTAAEDKAKAVEEENAKLRAELAEALKNGTAVRFSATEPGTETADEEVAPTE